MDDDLFAFLAISAMVILVICLFFFMGKSDGFDEATIQICNEAGYEGITVVDGERYCYSVDSEQLISPLGLVRQ